MQKLLARLVFDDEGQDLIEYALLGTLIALGCVIAMSSLGSVVSTAFTNIGASVTAAS
jgi:pilus assembly protein Flp/PilA